MKEISTYHLVNRVDNAFLSKGIGQVITIENQEEIKNSISETKFPKLTTEATKDNDSVVGIDESRFMNDKFYEKYWIKAAYGVTLVLACVNIEEDNFLISAIEINNDYKYTSYKCLKEILVKGIEDYAYYDEGFMSVVVYPFDTEDRDFWKEMGYVETDDGKMYKNF